MQNYAVVEKLSLEFFPGFNLLTGETGSGKSILVDALGLVLGGRASPDLVRTGQDRAAVTAVFQAESAAPWSEWLKDHGLGGDSEKEVILRREILSGGKSRLLVNDQPVTLSAITGLGRSLVDVHGQNEHVALLEADTQLELLDGFASTGDLLGQVAQLFRRRRDLEREMEELNQSERDRLRKNDLLRFQVQELEQARLEPGEDGHLEDEKRLLANAERLRAAAATGFAQLYEDEGSACSRLAAVAKCVEELRRYDASAEPYVPSLASARVVLDDLAAYLRDYLGKLEADPKRLEQVEDRLAQIDRLKRKYGKSIEEILLYRDEARRQLARLEHADERREELAREVQQAAAEYGRIAAALSEKRRAAARSLQKGVCHDLAQLGMEKARFEIHFLPAPGEGGAYGLDQIEFRISPNPGEDLRPLAKIASGGELSRLMLALKTVTAVPVLPRDGKKHVPETRRGAAATLVFDEVDAGIGGRVAECVGQRLKSLARTAQVLCVTHLPQIACFADHHYYVEKSQRGGRTVAEVRYLNREEERARELARMLSGSQITAAGLKHASAMLKHAQAM